MIKPAARTNTRADPLLRPKQVRTLAQAVRRLAPAQTRHVLDAHWSRRRFQKPPGVCSASRRTAARKRPEEKQNMHGTVGTTGGFTSPLPVRHSLLLTRVGFLNDNLIPPKMTKKICGLYRTQRETLDVV